MELVVRANLGSRAAKAGVGRCTIGPTGVSPTQRFRRNSWSAAPVRERPESWLLAARKEHEMIRWTNLPSEIAGQALRAYDNGLLGRVSAMAADLEPVKAGTRYRSR